MNILIKLELKVKEQFAINPYDENMYTVLKALTEKILVVKRLVNNRADVEKVAHDYASGLWLRVCSGVVIDHWTKYIMLNLATTLDKYYKSNNRSKVDVIIADPVDRDHFMTAMYGSSNRNEYVRRFELEEFLTTLYQEIATMVLRYSRTSNVVFNRKLYLSVLTNMFTDRGLIGLSDEQRIYVEFIVKLVRNAIYHHSLEMINNHEFKSLSTILKIEQES